MKYKSTHKHVAAVICDQAQILHEVLVSPNGPDVNAQDRRGKTALHEAAYFGDSNIIRSLLLHGGSTLIRDRLGRSPLQIAREQMNTEAYELLKEFKADELKKREKHHAIGTNAVSCSKNLGFLDLAEKSHWERGVLDGLYDPNDQDFSKTCVSLDLATELNQGSPAFDIADGHAEIPSPEDCTLYAAAKLGRAGWVGRKLSKAHFDPAQRIREPFLDKEQSPLHAAAQRGFKKIVKMLLESGLAVNLRDVCCRTPLHLAALYRQEKITTILLDFGADPNARDRWGETPFSLARAQTRSRILEILLNRGAQPRKYERYL